MNSSTTLFNSPVNKNITTNDSCASCYQKFNQQAILVSTQCNHSFHTKCINDRKIEHCPQCNVATSGGMHQIEISPLTTEQANNSTINNLLVNRDFNPIYNMLNQHIDICFCESILLEDILQFNIDNITNMLNLLCEYGQKSYDNRIKVMDMLANVLENNPNKNNIIDIFITCTVYPNLKEIALNHYIEQRNFEQAKTLITQNKILIPKDVVLQILLEDIKENKIDNIKAMLELINSYAKMNYNSSEVKFIIDNVLDKITTNFDNIAIVKIFLEYGFITPKAQNFILEYNIDKRDFNTAENTIKKYKKDINYDAFFNALFIDLSEGNIANIKRLFNLVELTEQIKRPEFKESLNALLNNIILDLNKLNVIVIFLNHRITTPQAINFTCSNYYMFREEFPEIKDIMRNNDIKFTRDTFKSELQKAINANNIDAIIEILELSKLNYEENSNFRKTVSDILNEIVLYAEKLEIVEILLGFDRSNQVAINVATEHYLSRMDFANVKRMINKYDANIRPAIFEMTMKREIAKNNVVFVKQILKLIYKKYRENYDDINKTINNILEEIVQYSDKTEILDTILTEGRSGEYNFKPLINSYLEQRNFVRARDIVAKYGKKDISSNTFLVVLSGEIQKNNIGNINIMLGLLKNINSINEDAQTINNNLILVAKQADNPEVRDTVGKYLASYNISVF